ncbi:MAG: PLP-dependent transferase [Planctomycetota bacterium]|nr:PLP-dependent transferase [Planctomycetota bacterium]
MLFETTSFRTQCVHAGTPPDPTTGSILTPIHQTTTFVQEAVGKDRGFTYSRAANPTVAALEARLAALEDAPHAVATRTGMAAVTTLVLATVSAGERIVCGRTVYGGTVRFLHELIAPFGVQVDFVDAGDNAALAEALVEPARLVLVESPANPTLELCDLRRGAELAHAAGALFAVDNTVLTPALQRPLDLGADVSVLSTTKLIEGHDATLGGALVTRDEDLDRRLRRVVKTIGCSQAPFDAWLTLRGITTLPLRAKQQSDNARTVARFLEGHPAVARVAHPDLESFPQRTLAVQQQSAGGPLIAFELEGGLGAGTELMNRVRLCSLAENLGAAETLITHPASMTHADVPPAQREAAGITNGLVRLSVGLEDPQDVIRDLREALTVAEAALTSSGEVTR